jgi:beta-phosphoglucomutase-like phosphatase (HAD superfamily)
VIEAVIFDMDGTLAETEEIHRLAFNQAFADFKLGWSWDVATYRALLKVTGGKERIAHFAAMNGAAVDAGLIADLHGAKTAIYTGIVAKGGVPLRPGVKDFIEAARGRGLRLAIATTTSMPNVEALLGAAMGGRWREIFPIVGAGDMVARKKPAPDVYELVLRELGAAPDHCVAIEDSRNGVQAARAAGIPVIAVRSAYCRDDDLGGAAAELPDCSGLTVSVLDALAPCG